MHEDETSRLLWVKNPNLVADGDFSKPGEWTALYRAERYGLTIGPELPEVDKVNIYRMPEEAGKPRVGEPAEPARTNNVLAMSLSRQCAENNGMACLSGPIKIEPDTRYRISFRYKSDGPSTHVFVKGYTFGQDIKGEKAERQVYERQVPPSGPTHGNWERVVCDINPTHPKFKVELLRIDLYAYLTPGSIEWDDVVVKAIGPLKKKEPEAKP